MTVSLLSHLTRSSCQKSCTCFCRHSKFTFLPFLGQSHVSDVKFFVMPIFLHLFWPFRCQWCQVLHKIKAVDDHDLMINAGQRPSLTISQRRGRVWPPAPRSDGDSHSQAHFSAQPRLRSDYVHFISPPPARYFHTLATNRHHLRLPNPSGPLFMASRVWR